MQMNISQSMVYCQSGQTWKLTRRKRRGREIIKETHKEWRLFAPSQHVISDNFQHPSHVPFIIISLIYNFYLSFFHTFAINVDLPLLYHCSTHFTVYVYLPFLVCYGNRFDRDVSVHESIIVMYFDINART